MFIRVYALYNRDKRLLVLAFAVFAVMMVFGIVRFGSMRCIRSLLKIFNLMLYIQSRLTGEETIAVIDHGCHIALSTCVTYSIIASAHSILFIRGTSKLSNCRSTVLNCPDRYFHKNSPTSGKDCSCWTS